MTNTEPAAIIDAEWTTLTCEICGFSEEYWTFALEARGYLPTCESCRSPQMGIFG